MRQESESLSSAMCATFGLATTVGECRTRGSTRLRVFAAPEQRIQMRPGREVLQSRIALQGKTYLVRVFVDVDRKPPEVMTVYRTSKIEKYWRDEL